MLFDVEVGRWVWWVCAHVCASVMRVCLFMCACIYVCACGCVHACVPARMCVCMCAYVWCGYLPRTVTVPAPETSNEPVSYNVPSLATGKY